MHTTRLLTAVALLVPLMLCACQPGDNATLAEAESTHRPLVDELATALTPALDPAPEWQEKRSSALQAGRRCRAQIWQDGFYPGGQWFYKPSAELVKAMAPILRKRGFGAPEGPTSRNGLNIYTAKDEHGAVVEVSLSNTVQILVTAPIASDECR